MLRLGVVLAFLSCPAVAEVVAVRTLPAGTILTLQDLDESGAGGPDGVDRMIGLQTRTIIYEGRPVTPQQLVPPVIVERNQMVVLAYEAGPLSIRTEGRALGAGAAGDVIRVMNMASRTTVQATIREDGLLTVAAR